MARRGSRVPSQVEDLVTMTKTIDLKTRDSTYVDVCVIVDGVCQTHHSDVAIEAAARRIFNTLAEFLSR